MTVTTRRSGRASFAAIAPGSPMPMAAKPLEMMTVFGRRVAEALGHPELVRADVGDHEIVGPQHRLQVGDDPLRQHGERVVVPSRDRRAGRAGGARSGRTATSGASSSSASRTSATTSTAGW